jgi:hypothetical protein
VQLIIAKPKYWAFRFDRAVAPLSMLTVLWSRFALRMCLFSLFGRIPHWFYADGQIMDVLSYPKPRGVWRSDLMTGIMIST